MIRREEGGIWDFVLLFAGQTVSQLGTNMTSFALVIWAYTKGSQVMASSLLAVCSMVPYLIVESSQFAGKGIHFYAGADIFLAGNDYRNAFACWILDRRIICRLCL